MNRRSLLAGGIAACGRVLLSASPQAAAQRQPLDIADFQPRSMLRGAETKVEKARFPVIDVHTHLCFSAKSQAGVPLSEERVFNATPEDLLPVMDRRNLRAMVNLTGGYGSGLRDAIARFDTKHPGRFHTFAEPMWSRAAESGYAQLQADAIGQAHRDGARGLKILKTLGLYLREKITSGSLVKIDDPRFDPMWETCGGLGLPVAIHVSDPAAFFLPIDRFNERYEELNNHPDWSFHGKDYPSNAEILDARNRVIARHPRTQFIVLHAGNFAEDLTHVAGSMDRYRNMHIEVGARIGELGRQPRASRKLFDRYQDRILFGTDAIPRGDAYPQQVFGDLLYQIYFRFLETEDEYFDYAPAKVPPQGRWKIYGLGLPEGILRKVYFENAARLLKVS
ncbi:MAG: amidohydrolase family protein [Bryobacteraceae bacterium]